MNRRTALSLSLFSSLYGGSFFLLGDSPKPTKEKEPKKEPNKDITKEARDWTSNKYASPPTKFRPGHVTPRKLSPKALTKTKLGYVVQLPSKAPVATPTVYKGKVYVSGGFHSKEFYCFNANNGKLVWAVNLDDDGPSSAVVEHDIVVFNTESCTIFALDANTGKHLWSYWLGDPLTSTPTIANGVVFTSYPARGGGGLQQQQFNNNPKAQIPQQIKPAKPAKRGKKNPPCSHVLAAFDLKTGKILWQRWIDSDVMSAPVAIGKELYATSFAGVVYKFNQKDGKILSAVKSRATSAPVIVGKDVYWTRRADTGKGKAKEAIASNDTTLIKQQFQAQVRDADYLDSNVQMRGKLAQQGKELDALNGFAGGAPQAANPLAGLGNIGQGNVSTLQAFQGSRLLHVDNRNINCMGDEICATDPKSGKKLWTVKIKGDLKKEGGYLAAPPASAGGQIFLASLKGQILMMDPKKGKVSKTWTVGSPVRQQPAIVDGCIFVGTQNGQLVMIDTKNKKFTGWTTWGGNSAHTGVVKSD